MPGLLRDVDPDGLLEYSVVYSDRSLNHMSRAFRDVMTEISGTLQRVYHGEALAIVPGGGTYAMESVARQFATGRKVLVIRNGWFSFRWSQIFAAGEIPASETVLKARQVDGVPPAPFAPAPLGDVVDAIRSERPQVVFAPHVETASGMILPDDYVQAVGEATREVEGLFVLDCIASGTIWVDMVARAVDVLISAPQKGWSGPPCAGLVVLGPRALAHIGDTTSTSFACDLGRWLRIMRAYEGGGHAYHATMPTDALRAFCRAMKETVGEGLDAICARQIELGRRARMALEERGFRSVAAPGFQAPGVVVSYTDDPEIQNGAKFIRHGLQVAGGVPLRCDEPEDFRTFRLGLFGLEKLRDVDRTVQTLEAALDAMAETT